MLWAGLEKIIPDIRQRTEVCLCGGQTHATHRLPVNVGSQQMVLCTGAVACLMRASPSHRWAHCDTAGCHEQPPDVHV